MTATGTTQHRRSPLVTSTPTRVGLVLAGLLGLSDVVTTLPFLNSPMPMALGIILIVLGVITLAGIAPAWRGSSGALWLVASSRFLSLLPALPVFFVDEVPDIAVPLTAVQTAVTLVAIVLVLLGVQRKGGQHE